MLIVQDKRIKEQDIILQKVGKIPSTRKMYRSQNPYIRPSKVRPNSIFQIANIENDLTTVIGMDNKINDGKVTERKNMPMKCLHEIEFYCEKSTLHGLRYVGDISLTYIERFFWIVAFSASFTFACYYITNIFEKWNTNPVFVAFSPLDATLNQIPFPAITICNMNQARKSEAERILKENNSLEIDLLTSFCNMDSVNYEGNQKNGPSWNLLQNFLIKVGYNCADTVKICRWKNEAINCDNFFNNELTDEGLCCSFNKLPPEYIFKNPDELTALNQTYPMSTTDWTPERGFSTPVPMNQDSIPLRPVGSGTHLGLTLVIDALVDTYYCSSTESVGFKIMISNPIETPKIADYGILLSPGIEARYIINPEIREARQSLRSIDIEKRQCYFENERPLQYYRTYSKRNCNLECQANHTLGRCKCIPYYLPKSKNVEVCSAADDRCVVAAKEEMELVYGNGSSCNCLQSCYEMNFDRTATYSELIKVKKFQKELGNISVEYFKKNFAVVHFFFGDTRFRSQIKSEIYGFTEVLSNVGGLLGLCFGFSILSLVEIFYYLTLKPFYGYLKTRKQKKKRRIPFLQ